MAHPRTDWRERLTVAEQHFPSDWVATSATRPMKVGASRRAYYGGAITTNLLSMPTIDDEQLHGALSYVDELNVHELGTGWRT